METNWFQIFTGTLKGVDPDVLENLPIFHLYFHIPESCSGLCQPSKMERLVKIANDFHLKWSLLGKLFLQNTAF